MAILKISSESFNTLLESSISTLDIPWFFANEYVFLAPLRTIPPVEMQLANNSGGAIVEGALDDIAPIMSEHPALASSYSASASDTQLLGLVPGSKN